MKFIKLLIPLLFFSFINVHSQSYDFIEKTVKGLSFMIPSDWVVVTDDNLLKVEDELNETFQKLKKENQIEDLIFLACYIEKEESRTIAYYFKSRVMPKEFKNLDDEVTDQLEKGLINTFKKKGQEVYNIKINIEKIKGNRIAIAHYHIKNPKINNLSINYIYEGYEVFGLNNGEGIHFHFGGNIKDSVHNKYIFNKMLNSLMIENVKSKTEKESSGDIILNFLNYAVYWGVLLAIVAIIRYFLKQYRIKKEKYIPTARMKNNSDEELESLLKRLDDKNILNNTDKTHGSKLEELNDKQN